MFQIGDPVIVVDAIDPSMVWAVGLRGAVVQITGPLAEPRHWVRSDDVLEWFHWDELEIDEERL